MDQLKATFRPVVFFFSLMLTVVPSAFAHAHPELGDMVQFGKRPSETVTIALAVVVLSGIYNSWEGLGGSLSPLPNSPWGRLLLLKLSFVLLALGHGVRVRFLLRTKDPWTQSRTSIMRKWVRAEALFILLVLVCSAWLANLPPADM